MSQSDFIFESSTFVSVSVINNLPRLSTTTATEVAGARACCSPSTQKIEIKNMAEPLPNSIEQLQALVSMLQKQLKAAGVDPAAALLSLDDIKKNLGL